MHEHNRTRLSVRSRHNMSVAVLLTLIMTLLAACGGAEPTATTVPSSSGSTTDAPTATTAPASNGGGTSSSGATKISWMIWADDIANDKNLNAEVKLFNDSHPDVQVELIGVGWNDYTAKLQALVAANTPPDVLSIQNEGDFVSKGFMQPLESFMANDFDKSRFVAGGIEPAYDGVVYGLRHDTAFWLLYYNKDMFDAAGVPYPPASGYKTVDEFMESACKIAKPNDMQWGMTNLHGRDGSMFFKRLIRQCRRM